MNRLDPAHPFNDDNDDDDLYVTMMYQYYMDNVLQPDPAPLLTRRAALNRDREEGHRRLVNDYFAENCVYQPSNFKRRFRLRKNVFQMIANAMEARYEFFQMRYDARGKRGFTGLQKCVAAIKLMAIGESPDSVDDYMRMSERTARESLYLLAGGVVETFGDQYLRKPSLHDMQQLYAAHEERHGFPGMLRSIDCTHWQMEKLLCGVERPVFERSSWSAFIGKAPDAPFTVNGNEYKFGYYLTDGIYPQYSTFVKAFRHPIDPRDKYFKRRQEGARKDIERAFGVLKSKWHIVEHAARPYELDTLRYIMYAWTSEYLYRVVDIQDQRKHKQLREDLADYIYIGHEDEDE
ncbi:uncharacterized protein LOC111878920 [Lactuca sativa]|uniref:uncharacterized protein LOC111878920 n=1 Tax=Lactuca sativa TaxID=4236 RepID=UPI0022AFC96C|nr:uncharacterized protein LOC111878920 [Lactuca sativa]